MKDGIIIVPVLRMCDEVLDRFGRCFGKKADVDVAVRSMHDGRSAAFRGLGLNGLAGVEIFGLFVLDVAGGFADVSIVGVNIEADFARTGRHKHGISLFGFLEERIGASGHGDGNDAFLLRLALIDGEVEGAEGFFFAVDFDHAVGQGVDDFRAED